MKSKRKNYSVWSPDEEVGYAFSTFKSYKEIVDAYAARAIPKAAVTPRIQGLADTITKDKSGERENAKAIYEWVVQNLSFAGNCIGVGSVVPRDLDFVLDNKMGDCKDHATLMQALLSAKGIKSIQALINAGPEYKLRETPVVEAVNHVINYIPSLDLFLDSSGEPAPFGYLTTSLSEKPVLLIDGFTEGRIVPKSNSPKSEVVAETRIEINPDGSAKGTTNILYRGLWASRVRESFRNLTKKDEEDALKELLPAQELRGSVTLEHSDAKLMDPEYAETYTYEVQGYIPPTGAGAMQIASLMPQLREISDFIRFDADPEEEPVDIACTDAKLTERLSIKFPPGRKILSVPDNVDASNDILAFHAKYSDDNGTVVIERTLDDRTPHNVCSAEFMKQYYGFFEPLVPHMKEQILYK